MNKTPDCALFWEGDMYFYQKAKNRSKSFSFLSFFDKYRYSQMNNNGIKLWKTKCHVELHQMELYIILMKNGVNGNTIDRTIYLNEKTRITLIERNAQKMYNNSKPPFLFINQNANENNNNENITFREEMQSSSSSNFTDDIDNSNRHFYTDFNEDQNQNDDYFIFSTFCEENDIILTADEENTVLELFVAIKSAYFNNEAISINDFKFISVLGRGSFGKVTLVQQQRSKNGEIEPNKGQYYALKSVHKMKLIKCNSIKTALNERNILVKNKHPFIVSLKFAFQTATKFYLGMEFLSGGELRNHMNKSFFLNGNPSNSEHHITFKDVQLYIAEISLAINNLHSNGVVYRDLKPENMMIGDDGHIKLTDFGLAEEIGPNGTSRSSCGTLEYIAPEIVRRVNYSFDVDWWSLGVVLYELIFHKTPFSDANKGRLFARIINDEADFPEIQMKKGCSKRSDNLNAIDELKENGCCVGLNGSVIDYDTIKKFVKMLLTKEPRKRLKFGKSFVSHEFWGGLDFYDILQKKFQPSFIPNCSPSVENFNEKFTCEEPCDSFAAPPVGEKSVGINGFSFIGSFGVNNDEELKAT